MAKEAGPLKVAFYCSLTPKLRRNLVFGPADIYLNANLFRTFYGIVLSSLFRILYYGEVLS